MSKTKVPAGNRVKRGPYRTAYSKVPAFQGRTDWSLSADTHIQRLAGAIPTRKESRKRKGR